MVDENYANVVAIHMQILTMSSEILALDYIESWIIT